MEETKILSGVPAPENKVGAPSKYPFEKMKVGDHFIWKCQEGDSVAGIRSSISTTARQRGFKVTVRTQGRIIKVWLAELNG